MTEHRADYEQLSLEDVAALPDPATRAAAAQHLLARLKTDRIEASRLRQEAVTELRSQGWSHSQVAELLHVSRGTAQGIAEGIPSGRQRRETQQRRNSEPPSP